MSMTKYFIENFVKLTNNAAVSHYFANYKCSGYIFFTSQVLCTDSDISNAASFLKRASARFQCVNISVTHGRVWRI